MVKLVVKRRRGSWRGLVVRWAGSERAWALVVCTFSYLTGTIASTGEWCGLVQQESGVGWFNRRVVWAGKVSLDHLLYSLDKSPARSDI